MNNHTTARIGVRVLVILDDGTRFVSKLRDIRSKYFVFDGGKAVQKKHIRSFCRFVDGPRHDHRDPRA